MLSQLLLQRNLCHSDTNTPRPGDFDDDGKSDLMIFRPSTGQWWLRQSSNNYIQVVQWGVNGDVPAVGDYDGDMVDDVAVFRPSTGLWWIIGSSRGIIVSSPWGLNGDLPVPKYDTP